ncbi:alpha/beta fold hydrolase [Roseofilum capinflatum]|uniref:Alpha/beta hydrolase n=1 Tax=Roseofilum capinflatum BLCC-M114 TaxID=3022440 RepID=A0ABT7BBI5_9CYAN|nr:alpha/beta hydrolase [Roseofilum capinflatum]MDJ1176522.1 alpha/beta hydrolase [Roseofilum capinflatum BLCC-M114]
MATRHTLSTDQLQLSYLQWHSGQEPVLLLHGLADHALVWSTLATSLGPEFHCIAPDLRGHGESDKPETGYTFHHLIADLEGLMEHLGWESAHIVGHSFSAKFLPLWASQNPKRFRSMTLVDPFFIDQIPRIFEVTFPLLYRVLPFLQGMGPFSSYEAAKAKAKTLKQYRGWSDLQQQVFQESIESKPDGTWGSKFTVAARNQIFKEVMQVAGLTQNLDIPTLLITPDKGLNRTSWQLKPYQTYLHPLKIETVPGNHWAFLVEPEPFNLVLGNFLQTQKFNDHS